MKSPARAATPQVPVGLMAPAGESVLTPLGDTGCATADVVVTARTPIALNVDLNISHSCRAAAGARSTGGLPTFGHDHAQESKRFAQESKRLERDPNRIALYAHGRAALPFSSNLAILSFLTRVRPMSSRPLSRQCLRCGS